MTVLFSKVDLPHEKRQWLDVIVLDSKPVGGQVSASCRLDEYELDTVFLCGVHVRPELRRRGIARGMLVHAIALARADGKHAISLYCKEKNTAALRLYRSLGFVRVHRNEDQHFMTLQLADVDALLDVAQVSEEVPA